MEDENLLYEVFITAIENSYNENSDKEIIEQLMEQELERLKKDNNGKRTKRSLNKSKR